MPDKQLLHLVIGGELKDLDHYEFRDLKAVDFAGAFPTYREAFAAWKAKAQATASSTPRNWARTTATTATRSV